MVLRRLLPRIRSVQGAFFMLPCKASLIAWISASQRPSESSALVLRRRSEATASCSRPLESSQRGELGINKVNTVITTWEICERRNRVHKVACRRVLTDGKYKLNTSHRLPANGISHVRKRFVGPGSKDGACVQEKLQRDDNKPSERCRDSFGLVNTVARC